MRVAILGGGIAGLSAAWYLLKARPDVKITLIEKTGRLGGVIETEKEGEHLFEKGPRTFLRGRAEHLLELIREVGLEEDLIFSDASAAKRFLWDGSKLRTPVSFLPKLLWQIAREPFIAKGVGQDESIFDFASRRFGKKTAELVFDPMTLGIYAGDIRNLSIQSCFPAFSRMEQERGSLLLGFLRGKKKESGLFTLKRGMGSLIETLQKKLPIEFQLGREVTTLSEIEADCILSALPLQALGKITGEWSDFPSQSLSTVSLFWEKTPALRKGFGYLVPSIHKEPLLGMIWDSFVFRRETEGFQATAMVRSTGDAKEVALEAARRHLGIFERPQLVKTHFYREAIPQFEVGYGEKLKGFQARLKEKFPSLVLAGNYLQGPSVDGTIKASKLAVKFLTCHRIE